MTINEKLDLSMRLQLCNMRVDAACKICGYREKSAAACRNVLLDDVSRALQEEATNVGYGKLKSIVSDILIEIGVSPSNSGYDCLLEGTMRTIKDPNNMKFVTKRLYPDLDRFFDCSPGTAERRMRFAIESAFNRCNYGVIVEYFGNTIDPDKSVPTVREFIAIVAERAQRIAGEVDHE